MRFELDDKPLGDPAVLVALSRLRLLTRGHYPGVSVPAAVLSDIEALLSLVLVLRRAREGCLEEDAQLPLRCHAPLHCGVGLAQAAAPVAGPRAG